ncbi:MAG: hypothetical protein AAGA48_35530 [Myxococcota bacterium]
MTLINRMSWAALGVALVACTGEVETDADSTAPPAEDEELLVACAFILGTDGMTGLIGAIDSLDADGTFDPTQAIPVNDGRPICATYGGALFATSPTSPELTRYDVVDGTLVPGTTISFAGLGIGPLQGINSELFQFVDDERAYFVDSPSRQLAVFDPSSMELRGSVSLDFDPPKGLSILGVRGTIRTGDELIVPFSLSNDQGITVSTTVFAIVDTTTDAVTFETSTSCGSLAGSQETASGSLVFTSNEAAGVAGHFGLPGAFPACLLDKAADGTFANATGIDLTEIAGGDIAGGFARGPGNTAFFNAYDETLVPLPKKPDLGAVLGAAAWTVRRIPDLDDPTTSEPVLGVPPGAGRLQWMVVDGRSFVIVLNADLTTTLYDVTNTDGETPAVEALQVPAILYSAFRVR